MAGKKKPQHLQPGKAPQGQQAPPPAAPLPPGDPAGKPVASRSTPKARQVIAPAGKGFEIPFSLPDKDDAPTINLPRLTKKLPWLLPLIYSVAIISFIPLCSIYYNRTATHSLPRWSLIPDMDNQPKWRGQQANTMFADHRSSRPWPEGTVARGMLRDDTHFYQGIVNGEWATGLPPQITVDQALLDRGRERYNIYCMQCHGEAGYGDGAVSRRAELLKEGTWTVPLTYHGDQVRNRPAGHIFNTITNGIRTMPAHGSQVSPEDRWAIIAWIRVLQASQHAELADLPAARRGELEARRPAAAPEAAAPPVASMPTPATEATAPPAAESGAGEPPATQSDTISPAAESGEAAPQESGN